MKIHIFQSHYNITKTDHKYRPEWFDYEICLKNLLKSIKGYNVDFHLVMDGKIEDNWIKKYKNDFISHEIEGGDMNKAALGMYKIAYNLTQAMDANDLIYFLENDYLHVRHWVPEVIELFSTFNGLNYISLYDHNDKYFLPQYNDLVAKVFTTRTHHWKTTPSTCGSYIVPKQIFVEDYKDHTTVLGDHNKWIYLNETKNRSIISPLPGLSSHCMIDLMSPTIDWEKINEESK